MSFCPLPAQRPLSGLHEAGCSFASTGRAWPCRTGSPCIVLSRAVVCVLRPYPASARHRAASPQGACPPDSRCLFSLPLLTASIQKVTCAVSHFSLPLCRQAAQFQPRAAQAEPQAATAAAPISPAQRAVAVALTSDRSLTKTAFKRLGMPTLRDAASTIGGIDTTLKKDALVDALLERCQAALATPELDPQKQPCGQELLELAAGRADRGRRQQASAAALKREAALQAAYEAGESPSLSGSSLSGRGGIEEGAPWSEGPEVAGYRIDALPTPGEDILTQDGGNGGRDPRLSASSTVRHAVRT